MKYLLNEYHKNENGQRVRQYITYPTYAEAQIEFEQMLINIKSAHKNADINRHLVNVANIKYIDENDEEVKCSFSISPANKGDSWLFSEASNIDEITGKKVKL